MGKSVLLLIALVMVVVTYCLFQTNSIQPRHNSQISSVDPDTELLIAPIRIHVISSDIDYLDAASVYTEDNIRNYFSGINETFSQANVTWEIESIVVEELLDDQAIVDNLARGTQAPSRVLSSQVNQDLMLSPAGWDLYVLRRTNPFGFGGVYTCHVNGAYTPGAAFVPLYAFQDKPQDMRKWAHELGHATGLRHTACEDAFADNLMMSASCSLSIIDRTGMDENEIEKIRSVVRTGKTGCF